MKAIKLASVFAVSAVAAAVSTTTLAAEPVFSGEAGLKYKMTDAGNTLDGSDLAEVEVAVDSGVVYAEIEFASGDGGAITAELEKAYVKQGAVTFGNHDGSLSDGAFSGSDEVFGGVATVSSDAAVRYTVMPGLKVALEGSEAVDANGDTELGVAASYSVDLGMGSLGLSAGSVGDDTAYNVGFSMNAGAATVNVNYGGGEIATATKSQVNLSVSFAASEQLTLQAEYGNDLEAETTGMWLKAAYTVSDVTYYVENESGDFEEYTAVGAVATF